MVVRLIWVTVRLWLAWGWCAALIAGFLLNQGYDLWDAILGGLGGVWVFALIFGCTFGLLGLFYAPILWTCLFAGTIWFFHGSQRFKWSPPTTGLKLALLSIALLAIGMLPLQLMSPVAPFMDVLAIPAAAQRIVSFHTYMPLDNNPYGLWSPMANAAGLELFIATMATAAGLHGYGAGVLAQSQLMFAITAFLILCTWRLGKALFNDTAGGIAALLLWWTCFMRRSQGVRGNTSVFALVALGLAFWLEQRRVMGGALLITGTAVYSLIGGLAVGLACFAVVYTRPLRNVFLVALALVPYFFIAKIDAIAHTPRFYPHTLLWDVAFKLNQYWLPYFVIFPAAAVLALIWRRWPVVCAVLLLPLLVYPWYGDIWSGYYDQYPHAIVQQWQWSWQFAREGYWAGALDRRWMLDDKGFETVATLQAAIDAGKITSQTHLLHLTDSDSMYTLFPSSVYTGINDDVINFTYDPNNLFEQGGRIKGPSALPEALSRHPAYIYDQRTNRLTIN